MIKFIKFEILLAFLTISFLSADDQGDFDLERIKTQSDRVYHDILIVEADAFGLLFRHRAGIAKVPFAELSQNLRMLYEPVEPMVVVEAEDDEPSDESGAPADGQPGSMSPVANKTSPVHFYQRARHVSIGATRWGPRCNPCASTRGWRSHWPRYSNVVQLARPECRAFAVQRFLAKTDLLFY